jgi:hypothetical protein
MGNPRALFASIGVSVSLVAAAALSLFTVSVVIAFGGWSAGLGESAPATTLVFGPTGPTRSTDTTAAEENRHAVVLRAPAAPRPRPAAPKAARVAASAGAAIREHAISHPAKVSVAPTAVVAPPVAAPAQVTPQVATGDGVRRLGDDLSSTVHNTGKALTAVTAPLGPLGAPVSSAVQKVVDLVAQLLQRTTGALGGTLDKVGNAAHKAGR